MEAGKVKLRINPSQIKNKAKRQEVYARLKYEKKKAKRKAREERPVEDLGEDKQAEKKNKTIDDMRITDETMVGPDDEEVFQDEAEDEFAKFFSNEEAPKIMLTTRPRPSGKLFEFIQDLLQMFPNAFFYPRREFQMKQICQFAANKKFTHLFVLSEKNKVCNGLIISHLPSGPTAFFKVTNVVPSGKVHNHGRVTAHQPELILNNFNTRLGHRVGRFLGACFPHDPEFKGRQVVTFHNQRDFIFVRFHRYIFEAGKAAPKNGGGGGGGGGGGSAPPPPPTRSRLQELGPRFTLKIRWLQEGTFDSKFGEYEWVWKKKEMMTSRRKFVL